MGAMTTRERVLAKRDKIAANRSKGVKTYKFKAGTTKLRILPMSEDRSEDFERKFGKTYLKSWDNQFLGIVDRTVTYDEASDPIRDLVFDAMSKAPDQETKEHYQKMLAKPRYVFNALILAGDPDQKPDQPVIIEVSETQFDDIMAQFLVWSEDDPDYNLAALDTGHVFTVERTGTGMETRYNWQATPKKAPLKPSILQNVHNLDAWIEAQVDGLEQKAIEFMQQVNAAVGIETTVKKNLLSASSQAQEKAQEKSQRASNVSEDAVTTQIEDAEVEEVEEADIEEVEDAIDDGPPEDEADVDLGTSDDADMDDILASLED